MKKVYQHIGVKAIDTEKGVFEIFNKYYFKNLAEDYQLVYSLYEDGKPIMTGKPMDINIAPRQRAQITLPYDHAPLKKMLSTL